jgi:hypothetical protein
MRKKQIAMRIKSLQPLAEAAFALSAMAAHRQANHLLLSEAGIRLFTQNKGGCLWSFA